jgi:hypothetical protein
MYSFENNFSVRNLESIFYRYVPHRLKNSTIIKWQSCLFFGEIKNKGGVNISTVLANLIILFSACNLDPIQIKASKGFGLQPFQNA